MAPRAGVLSLQGDAEPHRETLGRLGVRALPVRRPADLAGLSHLVLPGGESTTLHHLMELVGLWEPIAAAWRAGRLALFGTCAGAILLGHATSVGEPPPRWGLLDAELERNAYGRQLDSSARELAVLGRPFRALLIRAPRITAVGPDAHVLARDGDDPVLVEGPGLLAATFHPELAGDPAVHGYFLNRVRPAGAAACKPASRRPEPA